MDTATAVLLIILGLLAVMAPRMVGTSRVYAGRWVQPAKAPELFKTDSKRLAPGDYVAGTVLGAVATLTAANDVQTVTITGTPTGGNFRLYDPTSGKITVPIAYNAAAADVQAALITIFGAGTVAVTGGPGPGTPWVITFGGTAGNLPQQALTVYASALTGGATPAVANVHTTTGRIVGGIWQAYNDSNTDGSQVAKGVLMYATSVDSNGRHKTGMSDVGLGGFSAVIITGGYIKTADCTGLDAAAVTDLGRITDGDLAALTNPGTILRIT